MRENPKVVENRIRRALARRGERLIKSRSRFANLDDLLGYMIVDVRHNTVVAGSRFELTIEDVIEYVEGDTK